MKLLPLLCVLLLGCGTFAHRQALREARLISNPTPTVITDQKKIRDWEFVRALETMQPIEK